MGKEAVPDRWLDYKPIGEPIKGTRFIAFKVPLREEINSRITDRQTRLDAIKLLEEIPNLGLVIDLTNTNRYYDPHSFERRGVRHVKLMLPGKTVPDKYFVKEFNGYVREFCRDSRNDGKLIGVHCTHGVNRTGYIICCNMVTELEMPPEQAIKRFEFARGHRIEREIYRNEIYRLGAAGRESKNEFRGQNQYDERIERTSSHRTFKSSDHAHDAHRTIYTDKAEGWTEVRRKRSRVSAQRETLGRQTDFVEEPRAQKIRYKDASNNHYSSRDREPVVNIRNPFATDRRTDYESSLFRQKSRIDEVHQTQITDRRQLEREPKSQYASRSEYPSSDYRSKRYDESNGHHSSVDKYTDQFSMSGRDKYDDGYYQVSSRKPEVYESAERRRRDDAYHSSSLGVSDARRYETRPREAEFDYREANPRSEYRRGNQDGFREPEHSRHRGDPATETRYHEGSYRRVENLPPPSRIRSGGDRSENGGRDHDAKFRDHSSVRRSGRLESSSGDRRGYGESALAVGAGWMREQSYTQRRNAMPKSRPPQGREENMNRYKWESKTYQQNRR